MTVRGVVRWGSQVAMWLVILLAVAALLAGVLVPRVAGATPYSVRTGSMSPSYPVGTLVVVQPTDFDRLRVGDVITYQLESGQPAVATHRLVAMDSDLDGRTVARTQGDANDDPDPEPVLPVQVRGRVWYAVPWLGRANTLLDGRQREWLVYGVAGLLLGYAGVMFLGAARERRSARADRSGAAG